jgi:Ran GTPase-activating protein (RanGAP) involved in mRNA processing and transport
VDDGETICRSLGEHLLIALRPFVYSLAAIVNHKVNSFQRSEPIFPVAAAGSAQQTQITVSDASIVYQQKCLDLNLLPNPSAEKRFVEQFMNSISRRSLRFSGLGLGGRCVESVVDLLLSNPNLVYLDLSLNRIGDDGASALGGYFARDGALVCVDLRSNGIGIAGCIALLQGLRRNSHVTAVDLSAVDGIERNRVGTQGCQMLAAVLRENEVLSHLNLAMCGITADGCRWLNGSLLGNTSLVYLDLTANRFGSHGALNFLEGDGAFGHLTSLFLARNGIGDDASGLLCRHLEDCKTLRALDLSGNRLGQTFVRRLLVAFQNGARLSTLSLARNRIGAECEDAMHILIRDYPNLKHLNLAGNQFKDHALVQMADALSRNLTLLTLDLSATAMMDCGATAFAGVLAEHPSLQRLFLASNHISDVGGVSLGKALACNKTVVILSLRNNELRDETATALLDALAVNTTVADVDVAYNDFSYRSYVKLTQTIEEHKRTLNSNVAEVAGRHIEWLKDEERRLFDYRDEIKRQEVAVESITRTRDVKRGELQSLREKNQSEADEMQAELDDVRARYEELAEKRRDKQQTYNDTKLQLELKQAAAAGKFQNLAAKRQHAQTRCMRAEAKKKELVETNGKVVAAMKAEMTDLREQLLAAIEEALAAKTQLLEDEQRQKEEEERRALRERLEAGKKGRRKQSPKKTDTAQPKPKTKTKARPRTSLAKRRPMK